MRPIPITLDASNAALALAIIEHEIERLRVQLAGARRAYDSARVTKLCDDIAEQKAWADEARAALPKEQA